MDIPDNLREMSTEVHINTPSYKHLSMHTSSKLPPPRQNTTVHTYVKAFENSAGHAVLLGPRTDCL